MARTFIVSVELFDATKRFGWEFITIDFGISSDEWNGHSEWSTEFANTIAERIVGNEYGSNNIPGVYSYALVGINE